MDAGERLWPLVEALLGSHDVAGLAVAVVHEDEVYARGFGVRDIDSGAPVTPETMFHLASVSKPFVATAVVSLSTTSADGEPVLDLDAPVTDWIPELTLADGRQGDVTPGGCSATRVVSRTSRSTAGTTRSSATTPSATSLAACPAGG